MNRKGINVGLLPRDLGTHSSKFYSGLGGKERDSGISKLEIGWPQDSLPFLPLTWPQGVCHSWKSIETAFLSYVFFSSVRLSLDYFTGMGNQTKRDVLRRWGDLERNKLKNVPFHTTIPYLVKVILQIFMQQLMSKSHECTGQLKVKRSN